MFPIDLNFSLKATNFAHRCILKFSYICKKFHFLALLVTASLIVFCILEFWSQQKHQVLGGTPSYKLRPWVTTYKRTTEKIGFHGYTHSVSSFMFYQLVLIKICRQSSNHNMLITFQNRCAEVLASCLRKAMRKEQGKKYVENSSLIMFLTMRSKICLVESFRDLLQLELLLKMLTYTCSMSLPVILT